MKKADFFFYEGVIAQDDKYLLKVLCDEDKENYLKLYRETSIVAKASSKYSDIDFESYVEAIWQKIPEEDVIHVSIFAKTDKAYLGDIVLQNLSSDTPELGIDVLSEYRRQGVACETIPLFVRKVLELADIKYFLVRIYSDNEPSTKLFKKLGAVRIGEEPSEFAVALALMKERFSDGYEKYLATNPNAEAVANERCIVQYSYLPDEAI